MVIIRIDAPLPPAELARVTKEIKAQASQDGIIVLPCWCELLNEVPADDGVQIVTQGDRVAELEQELARAMFYISAQKDCNTCKHEMDGANADRCPAACEWCNGEPCAHTCQTCDNGSNWEWVGIHGSK